MQSLGYDNGDGGEGGGMMHRNTEDLTMAKAKVAITLERSLLGELDELVEQRQFLNRSQAIESAVIEKLERMRQTRLLSALSDLEPIEEKAMAEEGMASELRSWPEY